MARYKIVYQNTSIEAPDGAFLVGRSPECQLVIDDPVISREHFAILYKDERLFVEDKGSRNGVNVNGKRISGTYELRNGDEISVGKHSVRIVAYRRAPAAERTVGLRRCMQCGEWMSNIDLSCSKCGWQTDGGGEPTGTQPVQKSTLDPNLLTVNEETAGLQPAFTMAGLATKAIVVGKLDDAERLLASALRIVESRIKTDGKISDTEFNMIVKAIFEMARASKSHAQISNLFRIHRLCGQLMSRDLVEELYDLVRAVDYHVCPEMKRYLKFLLARGDQLNPGETFVFRRLQGLAKICS